MRTGDMAIGGRLGREPVDLATVALDVTRAVEVATSAAIAAGHAIRADLSDAGGVWGSGDVLGMRVKSVDGDVVTDLDLLAERIVIQHIRWAFPEHRILAEESGSLVGDGDWCWVVDPLDGTNNIAVGLPVCTVGIALCHRGIPVLGVVHEPITGRTWQAVRGRGAAGPGGPLRRRARPPNTAPVLAWTQGYAVGRDDPRARALRLSLESGARRLIQLWSPLLCWVMVGTGDIDGFVGYRTGMVDLPAGFVIAAESGVRINGLDGAPLDDHFDIDSGTADFVAAPPEVMPRLAALVAAAADITVTGMPRRQPLISSVSR